MGSPDGLLTPCTTLAGTTLKWVGSFVLEQLALKIP